MKDYKLEQRKETFQKNNTNILESRQGYKLSLRKEKIDDYIMKRREMALANVSEKNKNEINPEELVLPSDLLNKTFADFDFNNFVRFLLSSTDINYIKFGILHIRKQVTLEVNPPILEIMKSGLMQILMQTIDVYISHDSIVYEILWIFTNLTSMETGTEASNFFLTPKGLRIFDKILSSNKADLIHELIWLLTHIGSDNETSRDALLNTNLFSQILSLMEKDTINIFVLKNGIWMLSSISKGFNDSNNYQLLERIIRILCVYIRSVDQEIVGDCVWALANYSNTRHTQMMRLLFDMSVVPIIMSYKNTSQFTLLEAPLRLIGNILTGDDLMIDDMLRYNVISFLETYLKSTYATLRKESTWCFSNIAAGTLGQIIALVDSGIMPKIFELVKDPYQEIAREAIWVVSNCLTGADLEVTMRIANLGVMDPIIYSLINYKDPNIVGITLEAVKMLFQQGQCIKTFSGNNPFSVAFSQSGGTDLLEKLQHHDNDEIASIAANILETYYITEVINY